MEKSGLPSLRSAIARSQSVELAQEATRRATNSGGSNRLSPQKAVMEIVAYEIVAIMRTLERMVALSVAKRFHTDRLSRTKSSAKR